MLRDARHREHTVLLVEADPALRRMIALGLRHRGLRVIEADAPGTLSIPHMSKNRPDLVLLDIDGSGRVNGGEQVLAEMQAAGWLASLPIVLLSWDISLPGSPGEELVKTDTGHSRCTSIAKPFDARALYATIDAQLKQEQFAQVSSITRVTYAPPVSPARPSLCPILAAAGLLLIFAGLLLQLAVTGVGLLILIVTLLYWTLGSKPDNLAVA
jgi:DNA-binding response OmpR family regulator